MVNLLIGKNGIDWTAMGFTVYGECPAYGSTKRKRNNVSHESKRNISFTPAYKLWARLLQMDRGTTYILCEEWKQFENFEKWYNENYYEVEADSMEFTYRLFDVDNTILSPDTSCFLPRSINRINKRNYQLIELVKQYECFMPDNVRKHCEKLCEVLTNGKVE